MVVTHQLLRTQVRELCGSVLSISARSPGGLEQADIIDGATAADVVPFPTWAINCRVPNLETRSVSRS